MTAEGLNHAQRVIVERMVENNESGEEVRKQIDKMAGDTHNKEWDYDKNVCLVSKLAASGYVETAKHLEKKINNR